MIITSQNQFLGSPEFETWWTETGERSAQIALDSIIELEYDDVMEAMKHIASRGYTSGALAQFTPFERGELLDKQE